MGRSTRVAVALLFLATPSSALAGIYSDDLTRCLVKSTTDGDRNTLMQWVFFAMSLHPTVKPYSNITADQQTAINRRAGALFQRLMTVDCRAEMISAIKYEGADSIKGGFQTLGQIAMTGLMSNPDVASGIKRLDEGIDQAKMDELAKEAGGQAQSPPPRN